MLRFSLRFSRRALVAITFALLPVCGAFYFAQAQTTDAERAVVSRVLESRHTEARRNEGFVGSADGNFVVIDLGDTERFGAKARSHAVYDFAAKKVFIVTFSPSNNLISLESKDLR